VARGGEKERRARHAKRGESCGWWVTAACLHRVAEEIGKEEEDVEEREDELLDVDCGGSDARQHSGAVGQAAEQRHDEGHVEDCERSEGRSRESAADAKRRRGGLAPRSRCEATM